MSGTVVPHETNRNEKEPKSAPTLKKTKEQLLEELFAGGSKIIEPERTHQEYFSKVEGQRKGQEKDAWFDREDLAFRAYEGDHPSCIHELLKGAAGVQRYEYAKRLSGYFVNFRKIEPAKAYRKLKEWNKFNKPALLDEELKNVFDSASKGECVYGCKDYILKDFCDEKTECTLRRKLEEKKNERITYDEDIERQIENEVQRIIEADNQLEALGPHLDIMIVGESNNKKAIACLLLSSKIPNPKIKQIILLKATEGAGKTKLMQILTQGYKVKDVGRFSAHALDYSNLKGFDILRLKEFGAMDEEKQGVSTIKFLSSDDLGYTVETTVKDEETGRFTTEQRKIPPITMISSTTKLVLDAQFERRVWISGMDETPEQTERIAKWKAKKEAQEAEKILGLRKVTDFDFSCEVYKRFIEKFQFKEVIVPFPRTLLELLGYDVLRVRGDFDKILNFVKLYAQFNLKRLRLIRGDVYAVSPDVAVEAVNIVTESLSGMLSKIDKRTREVFDCLHSIIDVEEGKLSEEKKVTYDKKNTVIDKAIREKIAVRLGKSEKTIRSFFGQLESSGYVSSDDKKPKTFTLLHDISNIEQKLTVILAKTKSADILISEMEKETQEWLKTATENFFPRMGSEDHSSADKTSMESVNSPSTDKEISNSELPPSQTASSKSTSNDRQISQLPISQRDLESAK